MSIEVHPAKEWLKRRKEKGEEKEEVTKEEYGVSLVKLYSLLIQIDKKLDLILKELRNIRERY
ncbi:MAG: hypothetical protein DRJ66_00490 [Thermoprotei archaeon]|nr:MAG: hypothetical protein DRJ66_00490 [Thermoprotei archaeon]RLF20397.1 MAG: hypothetical protein DRZ82_02430 [Thermoprotei archaeon]